MNNPRAIATNIDRAPYQNTLYVQINVLEEPIYTQLRRRLIEIYFTEQAMAVCGMFQRMLDSTQEGNTTLKFLKYSQLLLKYEYMSENRS